MNSSFFAFLKVFDLGYQVGKYCERRSPKAARWYFGSMSILLVLFFSILVTFSSSRAVTSHFIVPFQWVQRLLPQHGQLNSIDYFFRAVMSAIIVSVVGLVIFSFPLSPLFWLFERRVKDSRPQFKAISKRQFYSGRDEAPQDAYFAGVDVLTKQAIFISDEDRMEHAQIVGVTGGGKTEGGIIPALIHDIAWGRGAIIIDMKGDRSLLEKVAAAVIAAGRQDDFRFFSLADPKRSHTYNPLKRGNASEIKDKIISSNIWSEIYYKKTSEIATLQICHALKLLERPVTFASLLEVMQDVKRIERLGRELDERKFKHDLRSLLGVLNGKTRDLAGMIADFTAVVASDFGYLLSPSEGEIDLLEAYQKNKIVLFQLNTGLYQETAIRLARMIVQDIKTVSNAVQAYIPPSQRHFFPIFFDEFASIAFEAFTELINKARASQIAISIAHQSLGDLAQVSDGFQNQIFDNTNLRMIFRQNSAESRDLITKMGGTTEIEKMTHQVQQQMGFEVNTGMGSIRRVESFQIDPNIVTELPTGHCVLVQHKKSGKERISYMKCDYIDMRREADFLRERLQEEPTAKVEALMKNYKILSALGSLNRRLGKLPKLLISCFLLLLSQTLFAQVLPPLPSYNSSLLLERSIDRVIQKIYDDLFHLLQPVDGKVSSKFGNRIHPLLNVLRHHNGIDIVCSIGSEVRAVLSGRVKLVAQQKGYGKIIELAHGGELTESRYAHLSSFVVKEGQSVKKGDLIGFSGQSGNVTGPHLHFELFQEGKAVDPAQFFDFELLKPSVPQVVTSIYK